MPYTGVPARVREMLLGARRAFLPTVALGGNIYFASDVTGQTQVHLFSPSTGNPSVCGDNTERHLPVAGTALGLLVRHDIGGNEVWQLSVLDEEERLTAITDDARAKHENPVVAPGGRHVGLARNPGGQDDMVLSVLDLKTRAFEDWASPGGYWLWEAWSPDQERAVVIFMRSPTRLEAHLLDRGGRLERLLPQARRVSDVTWLRSGRLLALSDVESEFMLPVEIDPTRPDTITRRLAEEGRDYEALVVSRDERRALGVVNDGPYDRLVQFNLPAHSSHPHEGLEPGLLFSHMSTRPADQIGWTDTGDVLVAWEGPTRPSSIVELTARRTLVAGDIDEELASQLVAPETVSYTSFDGLEIPALSYRRDGPPRPAVVYFHGGPESQSRANFQPLLQLMVLSGLDVLAPNVRGSTGFGTTYFSLDDRDLRWNAVRDGCEAARHLKSTGSATATAAMGRSYGGFMTLAVLVEDPDLWDAAVEFVGIADWHSFFRNTSGWRRAMRMEEYGDPNGAEADFLAEISPLRHSSRIRTPLLVIHGRNDPRVPVSESEEIATASGADLLVFENEGHGISRQENVREAYLRAVDFLLRHLPSEAATSEAAT